MYGASQTLFYRTSGRFRRWRLARLSRRWLSEEAAMQRPPACTRNRRLLKTEGCDDGGVVGFRVFAVDGEGCRLVVENFVVDLRTQLVFQQVSGHQHMVKHLARFVRSRTICGRISSIRSANDGRTPWPGSSKFSRLKVDTRNSAMSITAAFRDE